MFDRIGPLIALASSACLAGSVLFDLGYFGWLDRSMFLLLTVQDHLNRALESIPWGLGLFVIMWTVDEAYESASAYLSRRRGTKHERTPQVALWIGCALGVAGMAYALGLPAMAIWDSVAFLAGLAWYALTGPAMAKLRERELAELSQLLRWGPIFGIAAIAFGV